MDSARRILVGISGSIAAVKTPEIVRLLVDEGYDVHCFSTPNAREFVAPLSLATFTGHPVISDMYGPDAHLMPHVAWAEAAELMLIVPATATLLGRMAHGLAEDMVTLAYITTKAPVLAAPAMHPTMWEHPSTQENVRILKNRGVSFVGPFIGPLADKTHGEGRMAEPEDIMAAVQKLLRK